MAAGMQGSISIGIAESAYGTFQSPTRTWEAQSAKPQLRENVVQGGGLAGGRVGDLGSRYVRTRSDGTGTSSFEAINTGMGVLLARIAGSITTPVQQASSAAYLQTHAATLTAPVSDTIQIGVPDVEDATVHPYNLLGAVLTQLDFDCNVDDFLKLTPTWDAQQIDESNGLVAPTYPTAASVRPFHFGQLTVKAGVFGSEAAVPVKHVSGSLMRPMNTSRFYSGSALKRIPVLNGQPAPTGSLDVDYIDKTVFADKWAAGTNFSLIFNWGGSGLSHNIASTYYETLSIAFPYCKLTGDTPSDDSEDIVSGSFPFVVKADGTNPLWTCTYMSTDMTI